MKTRVLGFIKDKFLKFKNNQALENFLSSLLNLK